MNDSVDYERLLQLLGIMFKIIGFPEEVARDQLKKAERIYKEDPTILSILKHLSKGGKVETIEVSAYQVDAFKSRMSAKHIDFYSYELMRDDGSKCYSFVFKDKDKSQITKIRDAFALELSGNSKELDIYKFRELCRGKDIGVAEGLSIEDVYGFRNNVAETDLKYVVLKDKEPGKFKIYASDPIKISDVITKSSYDVGTDFNGKFKNDVDGYISKKRRLLSHIGDKEPYVIVDADIKAGKPLSFVYCDKNSYSKHAFVKDTIEKDGVPTDVVGDSINPRIYTYEDREKYFRSISEMSRPIMVPLSEFNLLGSIDKNGKAYLPDEINYKEMLSRVDTFKEIHKGDVSIIDKFPVKEPRIKEQDLMGYSHIPPSVIALMKKQMDFVVSDDELTPGSIAFPKDKKVLVDEWLNDKMFKNMDDKKLVQALKWQLEGRSGDFVSQLSDNVDQTFYVINPDDRSLVLEINRDGAHLYKNGKEIANKPNFDEGYSKFIEKYIDKEINPNPVILTQEEFTAPNKNEIITERANHFDVNEAIKFAASIDAREKEFLVNNRGDLKDKDLTDEQNAAMAHFGKLRVTVKGYEGAIFRDMEDFAENKAYSHTHEVDL